MRKKAKELNEAGPIIMSKCLYTFNESIHLVTGPKHVGKTSLCKLLCNYGVREMSQLLYVDLDPNVVSHFQPCFHCRSF